MGFPSRKDVESALTTLAAVPIEDRVRCNARKSFSLLEQAATLVEQIESSTYAGLYDAIGFEDGWNSYDEQSPTRAHVRIVRQQQREERRLKRGEPEPKQFSAKPVPPRPWLDH